MSQSLQSESWISDAFKKACSESRINLNSFATLGFLDSILRPIERNEKTEDRTKNLLELLIKKSKSDFKEAKSHLDIVKQEYEKICGKAVSIEADLVYRGLFGASSSFGRAAFEIGLAFDTVLNLPFLPGSSLKGAVKAAYEGPKRREIFGDEDDRSSVIFADSYPIGKNGDYEYFHEYFLFPDVINPHYKNDEMNEVEVQPTPIIHLTVSPGLRFRFIIAFRRKEQIPEVLNAFAVACHRGLGARTAVGYGRFTLTKVE